MSKINIIFNDTDYSIDESEFASVKAELETHLSSVMNGSGAVIKLGGSSYNIDSTKLTTATNGFVSHLGTISGNGNKVVVNNVAYSIDSTKLTNAVVEIESVLGSWNSGGDGSEEVPAFIESSVKLPHIMKSMAAAAIGNKVYLFGGNKSTYYSSDQIFIYDTETDTLTESSSTLLNDYKEAIPVAAVGNKVYLLGGISQGLSGIATITILIYDADTDTIIQSPTLLPNPGKYSSAASIGSKVYLFGGSGLDKIYIYDIDTDTITESSTILPVALTTASATAVGSKVYLFGGVAEGLGRIDAIYIYDTVTNTVTTSPVTLSTPTNLMASAAIGSKIYVFGGLDDTYYPSNVIYIYDTDTDTITTSPHTLPVGTNSIAAATVGDKVYLFGGYIHGSNTDTIYIYNPAGYSNSDEEDNVGGEVDGGEDNVGGEIDGGEYEVLPYLTFSSPSTFTLNVSDNKKYWDGTLEYSTDTQTWNIWSGTSAINSSADGKLYMRGTGNTYITGNSAFCLPGAIGMGNWVLTGNNISCIGNIENLLDYNTVANGEHPIMASHCYNVLFGDCKSLIRAPKLPATTLTEFCYTDMFIGCTSLSTSPKLPATTLANGCYTRMFSDCINLTTLPALAATTLPNQCYYSMFSGCAKIKLCETQTGEYQNTYRIPISETGTAGEQCFESMFASTGGTFTGTPTINTTYYTSNTIV